MSPNAPETNNIVLDSDIITKYKAAAQVANDALAKTLKEIVPGATILDLCVFGDKAIEEGLSTQYRKAKVPKGISFPTTVSVNNIACHVSPLATDPIAAEKIQDGDLVKVQIGAHVDGYAAFAGQTIVVGSGESNPVTGRKADAIHAAFYAAETVIRMLKPGTPSLSITDAVQKVVESFGCKPLQNMLSYQQKQNDIEAEGTIIFNPGTDLRSEFNKYVIAENHVYMIDIFVTTGSGKTVKSDTRTTVFKKKEGKPQLRMKTSAALYSEVKSKFGSYPFTTRAIDDQQKARGGVVECVKSGILEPFDVYEDKSGEYVAQVTFTALVTQKGPERITTGSALNLDVVKSEHSIKDKEILKLLATSTNPKKPKNKKNKKNSSGTGQAPPTESK